MKDLENKKTSKQKDIWDIAVIGGGPAGMMAAGRAAERGLKVVLLEKNEILGKKLLITGGGRCNVTNEEYDTRTLLKKFKGSDKFLFSTFSQFSVKEALDFFHEKNMPTKTEALKRVFPLSNKSESVWATLLEYIKKHKVTIIKNAEVAELKSEKETSLITSIILKDGREIFARNFVIATGGTSRPETGSTGDGYKWLKSLGHKVIAPDPTLVPIKIKDEWAKKIPGVSVSDIKINLLQNGVKQESSKGKILFTHFGLSGPAILNMSKSISELLKYGEAIISIDLLPSLDHGAMNAKLQELFKLESNKKIKNTLGKLVLSAFVPHLLEATGISGDTFTNSVTREERMKLISILKNLTLEVEGLLGVEKAIVTSGGVELSEVDFKTMQSRLYKNLYIIGDMLNIDRPSGGFSLQLCWTTGYVAGESADKNLL